MGANDNEITTVTAMDSPTVGHVKRLGLTAGIVIAYVSNNSLRASELPGLIALVHAAVTCPSAPVVEPAAPIEAAKPAVIRKSITPDALISFIDGKPYKMLKRHLTRHGMDMASYRARYGLPDDYPTVSASYSAVRATLAKEMGLGKYGVGRAATTIADVQQVLDRT